MLSKDTQRKRVYFSERTFATILGELNMRFEDHLEAQAYVDHMVSTTWWKKHFPKLSKVQVKRTTERRSYSIYGRRTLWLSDNQLDLRVLLHEMAHLVTPPDYDPGHGRNYTFNYLLIVRQFIGDEEADRLEEIFQKNEVKVNKLLSLIIKRREEEFMTLGHSGLVM